VLETGQVIKGKKKEPIMTEHTHNQIKTFTEETLAFSKERKAIAAKMLSRTETLVAAKLHLAKHASATDLFRLGVSLTKVYKVKENNLDDVFYPIHIIVKRLLRSSNFYYVSRLLDNLGSSLSPVAAVNGRLTRRLIKTGEELLERGDSENASLLLNCASRFACPHHTEDKRIREIRAALNLSKN
jgi:hypothetical protein